MKQTQVNYNSLWYSTQIRYMYDMGKAHETGTSWDETWKISKVPECQFLCYFIFFRISLITCKKTYDKTISVFEWQPIKAQHLWTLKCFFRPSHCVLLIGAYHKKICYRSVQNFIQSEMTLVSNILPSFMAISKIFYL